MMEKKRVIAPEYIYYFETSPAHPDRKANARPAMSTLVRIRRALIAGIAKILVIFSAFSGPYAAPSDPVADNQAVDLVRRENAGQGREALKAQMNALNSGLDSLRRLRAFFDAAEGVEKTVLARAQHLIETLPQNENSDAAAWRIAAVASLTIKSGVLSNIDVDNEYRLKPGAVGWDLGPEESQVHAGFTPVSPEALAVSGTPSTVSGTTHLSDGIAALETFDATLPNGLYRVLIVSDEARGLDGLESPFGDGIRVNGAPVKSQISVGREHLKLTGADDKSAPSENSTRQQTAYGVGVEAWIFVENGRIQVDFKDVPARIAITAIIAEPFVIDKVELTPAMAETLATALGNVAPAAGPDPRAARRGARVSGSISQGTARFTSFKSASAPRAVKTPRAGAGGKRTRFGANRNFRSTTNAPPLLAQEKTPLLQLQGTTFDNDIPFEERQILVKRSIGPAPDSEGIAVDLQTILDEASPSGIFLCLAEPCADTPPLATEPDLAAAIGALGDWLTDPDHLPDGWGPLDGVLTTRDAGAEIAVLYEFFVDTEIWTGVELRASAGSGLFVWLDGGYIFGTSESDAFFDDLDFEYRLELPDLEGGRHFLQVLSESRIPNQGYAIELRGIPLGDTNIAAVAVAEPETLALFGLGLVGIALVLRGKRIANVHHHREAGYLGRTVEISEGILHHRKLRNFPSRLKPIWPNNAAETNWRREGDSNPRYAYTHASFQDWCIQPLCHPSKEGENVRYPSQYWRE
jgi:hypothetical protein